MLLTPDEIRAGLGALVDELGAAGTTANIYIVGGAAIVLHTEQARLSDDVDALFSPTEGPEDAVRRVGEARRWPATWLGDAVKMWASHYDTADDWQLLSERGGARVHFASLPLLLAMKLLAGRGRRDLADVSWLLTACEVPSLDDAISIFDRYYPTETVAPLSMALLRDHFGEAPPQ